MSCECEKKDRIIDAECCYDGGKFFLGRLPACLPRLFTVRFTAPADYSAGDVIVVDDKELPVRTPGMTAATSGLFKAGAVMHCDVDMDRKMVFFWQNGGSTVGGVLPNLSYEEQFAGFYDESGDKVYVRSFDLGTIISPKVIPHNISNLKSVVDDSFRWKTATTDNEHYWIGNRTGSNHMIIAYSKTDIEVSSTTPREMIGLVTLYYTCTDR